MVQKNLFPLAEDLIKTEYNTLRAWVALNQIAALSLAFAAGIAATVLGAVL